MSRLLFLSLPIKDLDASVAFFTSLGFSFDPNFSDETGTCMIVSDQAMVMLLTEPRFADFAKKPIADPHGSTGAIVGVSAESRERVDELAEAALAAGAGRAADPIDMGFMYGRSFYDLDGHHWEVVWMDMEAAEQGPSDVAAPAG